VQETKPAFAALRRGEGKVKEKNKMKKLMIALAAVVSAVAVQAASVSWNFGVAAMDSTYMPAVGNVEISALSESWSSAFNGEGSAMFAISGTTDAGGVFATGTEWTVKTTATLWNDAMDTSADYVYSYVFTMPALPSDDPSIQSALASIAGDITAALDPFGMGTLPSIEQAAAAGWTAAPEPTSGLLLLLGVAGLALKRKRA
jgi:hypothetical protein